MYTTQKFWTNCNEKTLATRKSDEKIMHLAEIYPFGYEDIKKLYDYCQCYKKTENIIRLSLRLNCSLWEFLDTLKYYIK